jgi:hypothetical protein
VAGAARFDPRVLSVSAFVVDLSYAGLFGLRNIPEARSAVPAGRRRRACCSRSRARSSPSGPEPRLPAAAARPDRLRRRLHGAARGSSRPRSRGGAGAAAVGRRLTGRNASGAMNLVKATGTIGGLTAGQPDRGLRARNADERG